jgi:hypothetical protein
MVWQRRVRNGYKKIIGTETKRQNIVKRGDY